MIDWDRSYTCDLDVYEVNKDTWENMYRVPGSYSVSVSTDGTDDVPLLHTATFTIDRGFPSDYEVGGWYRAMMKVHQNGLTEEHAITTQLVEIDKEDIKTSRVELGFSGKSSLQPAADRKLRVGEFVPKEYDGAQWAADKLRECTPAPVHIVGDGFRLQDYYVFATGESYLSAVWSILGYGDWCIQLDGRGEIYIKPKPKEVKYTFFRDKYGLLDPSRSKDYTWSGVPNRYIARMDGKEYVAENHNPRSPLSYERRGRWVEEVEENPTLLSGESAEYYVRRKLAEVSSLLRTYTYKREFIGDVQPYDLLEFSLPKMNGTYRVLSQTLTIGKGVTVSEKVGEVVEEYEIDV